MENKQKLIILPGWSGNAMLWKHQCQHLNMIAPEYGRPRSYCYSHRPRHCRKMAEAVVKRTPYKFILVGIP